MLKINGKKKVSLSDEELQRYHEDGIVYIESFYNLTTEILPIRKDIYRIIGLIIAEYRLPIKRAPFTPEHFDVGLPELIAHRRELVSIIYDTLKRLPSYVRLANHQKHEDLAKILLGSGFIGFANRGYGIRMDHPNEDQYLTQWHQDYVAQLCSQRGVVLWSPLRDVTLDVGPVMLCPRSHREGVFPIVREAEGSHGLKIKDEGKIIGKYTTIVPEVKVGDLVVIDYMTLHSSSPNRSPNTRWSMISRYFDFLEKTGISHGWKGGLQEGNSFEQVHPELSEIIS